MINVNELLEKQPILLFDGECGFCNKSVQFFLLREKRKTMNFIPLQSPSGIALRKYFEIADDVDSIILIKEYSAYIKSCAALRLTLYMKGAWPMMSAFLIIPPFLRNMVYALIAKNRMRFFGKVESCSLIPLEDRKRILDKI